MTYIIAVFRSRTDSIRFADALAAAGVPASLINTPREAMTGCGVSVRYDARLFQRANAVFASFRANSFSGFYRQTEHNGRTVTVKF